MKVGDLVRKRNCHLRVGVVVYANAGIVRVNWGSYGTFATPAHTLEVINESR